MKQYLHFISEYCFHENRATHSCLSFGAHVHALIKFKICIQQYNRYPFSIFIILFLKDSLNEQMAKFQQSSLNGMDGIQPMLSSPLFRRTFKTDHFQPVNMSQNLCWPCLHLQCSIYAQSRENLHCSVSLKNKIYPFSCFIFPLFSLLFVNCLTRCLRKLYQVRR